MKRNLTSQRHFSLRGFHRKERLGRKIDLSRVFRSSFKLDCEGMKIFYRKNDLLWNRIAVTTRKGFKGAVKRNRQKRIVREIYRDMKHSLKTGFDVIFLLYPGEYSFPEREKQIMVLLNKAKLTLEE